MLVCTLGDLVLDVIVTLDRPLVAGDDVAASTRVYAGGQAANVAAWTVALGARARFVGARGDDGPGRLVEADLAARGVELAGPVGGRSGVVVAVVGEDRDRSMASDRGAAADLAADALDAAWFAGCDWLHVSGYMLSREPGAGAAAQAARLARAAGAHVSLDAASAMLIATVGPETFARHVAAIAPDIVFATAREHAVLDGSVAAATTVVKRGALGCRILRDGRETDLPAVPVTAVDTTGAGDAFAAGYLVGGPELALQAGARCASTRGAMP
jgi:sugar/nucleoside kinase (ribokinase family)